MIQIWIVFVFVSLFVFVSHIDFSLSHVTFLAQCGSSISITPLSTVHAQYKSYFVSE